MKIFNELLQIIAGFILIAAIVQLLNQGEDLVAQGLLAIFFIVANVKLRQFEN